MRHTLRVDRISTENQQLKIAPETGSPPLACVALIDSVRFLENRLSAAVATAVAYRAKGVTQINGNISNHD